MYYINDMILIYIYIYIQGAQNAKTKNLPQTKSQVCTILLSEEKKQAQNNLEPGARSVVKTDLDIQQFPLGLNSMSLQYRVHVYMYIYILCLPPQIHIEPENVVNF